MVITNIQGANFKSVVVSRESVVRNVIRNQGRGQECRDLFRAHPAFHWLLGSIKCRNYESVQISYSQLSFIVCTGAPVSLTANYFKIFLNKTFVRYKKLITKQNKSI